MKRLLLLAVFAAVLAVPAWASAAPTGGTFSVTPSVPVIGDSLVFTGCGWNATNSNGQNSVAVDIQQPDFTYTVIYVSVAKSGCFTTAAINYPVTQTGTYSVFAFQKYRQAFLSLTVS